MWCGCYYFADSDDEDNMEVEEVQEEVEEESSEEVAEEESEGGGEYGKDSEGGVGEGEEVSEVEEGRGTVAVVASREEEEVTEEEEGEGVESDDLAVLLEKVGAYALLEELRKRNLLDVAREYFRLICEKGAAFAVHEPGRGKSFIALAVAVAHIAKFNNRLVYIITPTKNIQEIYIKLAELFVPHDKIATVAIFGKEGSNLFRFECKLCPGKLVSDSSVPCERVRRAKRYGRQVNEVVLDDGRVLRIEPPFACPEKLDIVHVPYGSKVGNYKTIRVMSFSGEYHFITAVDIRDPTNLEKLCPYYRQFALLYYYLYVEKKPTIVVINLRAFEHNRFRLPAVKRNDLVIWDEADKLMLIVESIRIDREFFETLLQELDRLTTHEDVVIRVHATNLYRELQPLYNQMFRREDGLVYSDSYRLASRAASELVKAIVLACSEGELAKYYPDACQKAVGLIVPSSRSRASIKSILKRDYSASVGVITSRDMIVIYREVNEPINNIPLCNMLCMTATPPTESEIQAFIRRLFKTGNREFAIARLMGKAIVHITGEEMDLTRSFFDNIERGRVLDPERAYDALAEFVIRLGRLIEKAKRHGPVYVPVHHVDPYLESIIKLAKFGERWANECVNELVKKKIIEATKVARWLVKHVETARMNRGLYTKFAGYIDAKGETVDLLISTCVDRGTSLENTGAIVFIKKPLPNFDLPEIRVKAERTGRLPATVAEEECLRITLQWLGRVLRKPDKVVHIYTLDRRMLHFLQDYVAMYVNIETVIEPELRYVEHIEETTAVTGKTREEEYGSIE